MPPSHPASAAAPPPPSPPRAAASSPPPHPAPAPPPPLPPAPAAAPPPPLQPRAGGASSPTPTPRPMNFLSEKILKGTFFGNYKPFTDLPNVVEMYMRKELEVEKFITNSVPFS